MSHLSRNLLVTTASLAFSVNAFAFSASELKKELEEGLEQPFSMAVVGPIKGSEVEVSGDGPFEVTISGGEISDTAIPNLSFTVTETGDGVYKVADAKFGSELRVEIGNSVATIEDLTWSGTWSTKVDDFTSLQASHGLAKTTGDLPMLIELEGAEFDFSAWDAATGTTKVRQVIKPMSFKINPDALEGRADELEEFSNQIGEMTVEGEFQGERSLNIFRLPQLLVETIREHPEGIKDEGARRQFYRDAVSLAFQPIDSADIKFESSGFESTLKSEEANLSYTVGKLDGVYKYADDSEGTKKLSGTATIEDYRISVETKVPNAPSFDVSLKSMDQEFHADRFEPKRLRAGIEAAINDGKSEIQPETLIEILSALGGFEGKQTATSMLVENPQTGKLFSAAEMGMGIRINAVSEEDRISEYVFRFSGLDVPAVDHLALPPRVVPGEIVLEASLTIEELAYYMNLIGKENLGKMLTGETSPQLLLMENLDGLIKGVNEGALDPKFRINLVRDGEYDFDVSGDFELGATNDPSEGPVPSLKGNVVVSGLDDLKTFIMALSPDLPDDYQAFVWPAIGGLGMVESLANEGEGGALSFDVELIDGSALSVNGNEFPLPGR